MAEPSAYAQTREPTPMELLEYQNGELRRQRDQWRALAERRHVELVGLRAAVARAQQATAEARATVAEEIARRIERAIPDGPNRQWRLGAGAGAGIARDMAIEALAADVPAAANDPGEDEHVWLAAYRRGLDYHHMEGGLATQTMCGRSTRTGYGMRLSEAVSKYDARPCPRCADVPAAPVVPADPYTTEARLCDDNGMVSDQPVAPGNPGTHVRPGLTYRQLLNNLRAINSLPPFEGEPFLCTGSAHLAGMHFRCTSPAHSGGTNV